MYIRARHNGRVHVLNGLSKSATTINQLRKMIRDATGVDPTRQRLFAAGKQLEDGYVLYDYGIDVDALVEVTERVTVPSILKPNNKDKEGEDEKVEPPASTSSAESTQVERDDQEIIRIEDIYDGNPSDLQPESSGYDCKRCKNDPNQDCKNCGCNECGRKDDDANQLICDECEMYYHIYCLDPPMESIPDGDWYCPVCRNDENEIVGAGKLLKASKKKSKAPAAKNSGRNWGRGMAVAGRRKVQHKVPANHFGPIPGIDVGMCFKYRIQISEEGIHRPPVAGIAGKGSEGAQSIVLSGGFPEDVDSGEEFYYTGSGGKDLKTGNKRIAAEQSFDQELTKMNLALAVSCHAKLDKKNGAESKDWRKGKPIRVVRTEKLKKHSKFAPEEGCRYDGLYKIVKYWPVRGSSGFLKWKYLFRRDDSSPAPWTKEGEENARKNGYVCIFPENYQGPASAKNKTKATDGHAEAPSAKKAKYEIPADILELMDGDTLNSNVWDELREKPMSTRMDFTNLVEELFGCPICLGIVVDPVTTACRHNLCRDCLGRLLKSDIPNCPSCRACLKTDSWKRNAELRKVLLAIFPGYDASSSSVTVGAQSDSEEDYRVNK